MVEQYLHLSDAGEVTGDGVVQRAVYELDANLSLMAGMCMRTGHQAVCSVAQLRCCRL